METLIYYIGILHLLKVELFTKSNVTLPFSLLFVHDLRSKQIESACFSGTAAFMEVRIQSVVVEFILNHVDVLFSAKLSSLIREGAGTYRHQLDKTPAHIVTPLLAAAST